MTEHTHDPNDNEYPDGGTQEAQVLPFPAQADTAQDAPDSEANQEEMTGPVVEGEVLPPRQVDQPYTGRTGGSSLLRQEIWQPVLPAWARDRQEFYDTAQWAARYVGHTTAFHALRCPVYVARLLARAPLGSLILIGGLARWLTDAEGRPVRNAAARREDAETYIRLSQRRDARIRARLIVASGLGAAGIAAVLLGHALLPALAQYAAVTAVAAGLGWVGAPKDKPVVSRAVESTKIPKLTSNAVEAALVSLGISQINQAMGKGGEGIGFPRPIARDGKGWRADVDLPRGVTPGDVMDRRGKLASGLRRPLGCVWPEGDPSEHEGRLVLWVGDQDMRKAKQPAWALRKGSRVDLFQPQPFGTDQRGRWVDLRLMFVSVIIGAIPRMGKTFALRELLVIAALDPRAQLHCYDLKGTGDLDALEPVAHRHAVGDDDEIDYGISDLRALRDELRRRAKLIRDLAKQGLCPENKVTPELASKKSLGLHPIVIAVDECQVWFEHPEYGGEFESICTDLVKRGPALGIVMMLATQRPDAKSLPTGISANASTRYCLKVGGQTENDMVLGTSKYKQGVRATTFSWEDKGIGYLVGEGADAQIVRTVAGLDGDAAKKVVGYARALREQAGTLTGHAIGQYPEVDTATSARRESLLEDIAAVVGESEKKVWNERVITRLQELRPEVYDSLTKAEDLTAALKRHGIATGQVWGTTDDGTGTSRIGITRADITTAITERDRNRAAG